MRLGMVSILITGNRRIGRGKCNEDDNTLQSNLEAFLDETREKLEGFYMRN